MKISLSLGAVWCILYIFTTGSAQKVNGVKGEVELITEPRPGDEYVQIHTTNGKQTNKYLKPSGTRFGGSPSFSKDITSAGSERDIPINPAKDKRLLRFTANKQDSDESADDMKVSIIDEGRVGIELQNADDEEEKEILEHKIDPISNKKDVSYGKEEDDHKNRYNIDNVSLYMESKSGVQKSDAIDENKETPIKQLSTSKPILEKSRDKLSEKKLLDKKYDILTLTKQKNKKYGEDNFDFVDAPFEDKLVSAGTSQTSRINVKKGPNGQDYEYEYVYYYYDEDDDSPTKDQQAPVAEVPQRPTSRNTTPLPPQTSWRQQTTPPPTTEAQRFENSRRGRPNENTRYTVSNANLDLDIPTEKLSNELLPVTSPSRFRNRGTTESPAEPTPEQTSTRFPPRSRGSASTQPQQQQFISSTTPAAFESTPTRARGNIRRPSLELVDSSSFRTHSSDVSPDQDQKQTTKFRGDSAPSHIIHQESFTTQNLNFENDPTKFQTRPDQRIPIENNPTEPLSQDQLFPHARGNSVDSSKTQEDYRGERLLETTRESDLEEYISGTNIPAAINDINQNTLITKPRQSFETTDRTINTFVGNTGMPDKAAFDLYAILQQMHNEESNYLVDENSGALDQNGISLPATVQFPVVQTTTTSTTTTTTTTTTPVPTTVAAVSEPAIVTGKGRFKNNLSQRNRFKTGTTSTTTEIPADQSTIRARKFQPAQQRPQGQPSAYARRQKTSTSTPLEESSVYSEEPVTRQKSRFGSRNRFSSSSGSSTTTSATLSSTQPQASVTRASSDRFSSRRRPSGRLAASSSTTVSSEGVESSSASSDTAQISASTPRARLSSNSIVRPLRPGPRINIGGARGRLGASSTTPTPEENKSTSDSVSSDEVASESAPQTNQENQPEVNAESSPAEQTSSTTPDALTRLRNRPRLSPLVRPARPQTQQSSEGASINTPASPAAPAVVLNQNRRQLGNILSRQRPGQTFSTQATSPSITEEEKPESIPVEEVLAQITASTEATQATTENKISSLISRRRNIAARRPGTLQTRSTTTQ